MSLKSTCVLGSIFAALATTTSASAIDVHVSGDDWGVWVTGIFSAIEDPASPGTTQYALTDGGSGIAMDFDLTFPDGSRLDGADITSRMITADVSGNIGDDTLELLSWSVWVEAFGVSVHVTYDIATELDLVSTNPDGTSNYASLADYDVFFDVAYADGTTESFTRNVNNFEFSAVPTPGATALLGLAGFATARRRRS